MTENLIKTNKYDNDKQILLAPELAFTMGCIVDNKYVSKNEEGKRIIKAGTPVGGANILLDREAVLSLDTKNPIGILLHDVDVTLGEANATILIDGYVDINKLDDDVKIMIDNLFYFGINSLKNIRFIADVNKINYSNPVVIQKVSEIDNENLKFITLISHRMPKGFNKYQWGLLIGKSTEVDNEFMKYNQTNVKYINIKSITTDNNVAEFEYTQPFSSAWLNMNIYVRPIVFVEDEDGNELEVYGNPITFKFE